MKTPTIKLILPGSFVLDLKRLEELQRISGLKNEILVPDISDKELQLEKAAKQPKTGLCLHTIGPC